MTPVLPGPFIPPRPPKHSQSFLRVCPETLLPCEPAGHELDHGEPDQGEGGSGQVFEVAGETTAAGDPRQRSFDDPTLGQNVEALAGVRALDDVEGPRAGVTEERGNAFTLVAAIGEDLRDEWEHRPRPLVENQRGAIPILNVGGVNDHHRQQAERVDQDVVLDTLGLFAGVVADRVDPGPPFSPDLTVLLSMIAAVGLASLPTCSRQATYR